MNDYLILTFVDGETVVIHDDLRFDTNLQPELSFAFDALYFEPPSGHCVKRVTGPCNRCPKPTEECAAYCRGYAAIGGLFLSTRGMGTISLWAAF